jgi:replicative DNA helicase
MQPTTENTPQMVSSPIQNITREEVVLRRIFDDGSIQNRIVTSMKPELFSGLNENLCIGIRHFYKRYKRFPTAQELLIGFHEEAPERLQLGKIMGYAMEAIDRTVAVDLVESFFREGLTESVLTSAAEAIQTNKVDNIADLVEVLQKAVNFTIQTDTGLSAITDMHEILKRLNETHTAIPSAIDEVRGYTGRKDGGGGWYRSALSVFMGMPNVGKTIFMCNEAAYAYKAGFNVLYVTLEMGAELIHERIIANVTDIPMNDVRSQDPDELLDKYKNSRLPGAVEHGDLVVKRLPTTTTVIDIENVITELKISDGIHVDIIFVDYLGIMKPVKRDNTVQNMNMYSMGKEVAEQLRDMGDRFEIPVVSASQLNRDGYNSTQASMKDVAGSAGINDTADFIITITQDPLLKSNKMFFHTIIKNRYGPNMVSFLTQCDYSRMRVTTADDTKIQSYNDAMMSQQQPIEGFNADKDNKAFNTKSTTKSKAELDAQAEMLAKFTQVDDFDETTTPNEASAPVQQPAPTPTQPIVKEVSTPVVQPTTFPTNPMQQRTSPAMNNNIPSNVNSNNVGVVLPPSGDAYGI